MSRRTGEIRWLHLSDFHFQKNLQWSHDVVLSSLLGDINTRYKGSAAPDLIFITGDIAFSGNEVEYALAEVFVRKILDATSLDPERLFIIPGNHDINISLEEDAFHGARASLVTQLEVDRFFRDAGRRRTIFRRQEAFRNFANRIAPPSTSYSDSSFVHWKGTKVGPLHITGLLLDSAWLAGGGEADTGSLLIGEPQVIDAFASSPQPALTFGLAHHPFAWLREFEQAPIENLLIKRVHVMLRGHVHAADLRAIEALERRLTVFTAGAAFETRTAHNTYSYCVLNLLKGVGEAFTHRYVHADKEWERTEPKPWRLVNPAPVEINAAIDLCADTAGPYPMYKASLLAGLVTEVPRCIANRYRFLNVEIDVAGESNPLLTPLLAIRHLVNWRSVWDKAQWQDQVTHHLQQIDTLLKDAVAISPALASELVEKDRKCSDLAASLVGHLPLPVPSFIENLQHLVAAEQYEEVIQFVQRSRAADVLTAAESRYANGLEIIALLKLGKIPEAVTRVKKLMEAEPPDADLNYLAAQCYYSAKEYSDAARYMHQGLDCGGNIVVMQQLALHIAGHSGDAALRKRVL